MYYLRAFWSKVVLVGNPMMGVSKMADMTYSKAIGRIIKVTTMMVKGAIERVFIVAKMADYVAKTRI